MCRKLLFLIYFVFLLGLVLPSVGRAVPYPTYYYKMDEVDGFIAGDSSGNDYDANVVLGDYNDVNGIEWLATGKLGGCVFFNDSNDSYIELDPNGIKNTGGVVAMWVRLASPQSTRTLNGDRFLFGTSPLGDKVQLYMRDYSKWLDVGFGTLHVKEAMVRFLQVNQWYHVALTWDCNDLVDDPNSGTLKVYVNNYNWRTSEYFGQKVLYKGMANIGSDADYHQQSFNGRIDEVAIWDTNLPATDICDIYYHNFSEPDFNEAMEPSPGRGEPRARPDKILSWTPGAYAKGHDVYFGTDLWGVTNATRSSDPCGVRKQINRLNIDEVQTITTADEPNGGTYTLTFDGQTTAAIEHNDVAAAIDTALEALSSIGSGDVTVSGGPIGAATPIVITFQSALGSQDVGAITIDVTNLTTDESPAATPTVTETTKGVHGTSWPPDCNLVLDETYYWAVDEVNETKSDPNFWPGNVWEFTVNDGKATDPHPDDETEDGPDDADEEDQANQDETLRWKPGDFADHTQGHDVYLGTNFNDVNTATTATAGIYKGRQDVNEYTCSDSNLLTLGEVYYLRVDEVNATWEPAVAKGDIWAFKSFIGYHLDTFETYTSTVELQGVWTRRDNGVAPTLAENGKGHASDKAMYCKFKNCPADGTAPYFSEFGMQPPQVDITWGGIVKALSLWYKCDDQYTNQIYAVVRDNSGKEAMVIPDDPNIDPNTDGNWHQWNVDFAGFAQSAPNDVNMANVDMLYFGVGDGTDVGTGFIYFDDIDLYLARCVYDTIHPVGDVERDCVINWEDIEEMNDDWLESDYNSLGYDGVLHGFTGTNLGWTADGNAIGGRCIYLSGGYNPGDSNDWVDIDDYALPKFQNRTISLWVKSGGQQDKYAYRGNIFGTEEADPYWIEIAIDGGYQRLWHFDQLRAGIGFEGTNDEDYEIKYPLHTDEYLTEWSHVAMVLHNVYNTEDPTWDGDPCTVRTYLYHNGQLAESADIPDRDSVGGIARHTRNRLDGVNIGSSDDGDDRFVRAWIDDFRIYDYNMTQPDVCDIYRKIDGATPGQSDIIVWYKFDETSGMIAEDSGSSYGTNIYHQLYVYANLVKRDDPNTTDDPNYLPANPDIVNLVDYSLIAENWLDKKYWPTW